MKNYEKGLLLLLVMVGAAPAFAQRGHHASRDNDRYVSSYHPYSYRPVQPYYHVQPYYPVRPYYGRVQPSVSIIAQLPFGAVVVNLGSNHYHYYDGRYYEPGTGGYIIVQPPMGIIVPVLPTGAVSVLFGSRPYYRYESVYYMPIENNRYQVVAEPTVEVARSKAPKTSTDTEAAPSEEYSKLVLDGKTYYKKGNKYYKAKLSDDGEIAYEEVGEVSR